MGPDRLPNVCLAGGVALNAVVNGRIRSETPFERIYVQPAANDSGTAVGAPSTSGTTSWATRAAS